jgi:hypothetical protein
MEVNVRPEVQAKLDQMVRESGHPSEELVEEAIMGYFDGVPYMREMLDRRYDDLEGGRVKLGSDEIRARLPAKSDARLAGRS